FLAFGLQSTFRRQSRADDVNLVNSVTLLAVLNDARNSDVTPRQSVVYRALTFLNSGPQQSDRPAERCFADSWSSVRHAILIVVLPEPVRGDNRIRLDHRA